MNTGNTSASKGQCPKCQTLNEYSNVVCSMCGGRLPWADALDADRQRRLHAEEQAKQAQEEMSRAQALAQNAQTAQRKRVAAGYEEDNPNPGDSNGKWLNVFSFWFPIFGIPIWIFLAAQGNRPIRARGVGRNTLCGLLLGIFIVFVIYIIGQSGS